VEKYLLQYAEPGTAAIDEIPAGEPWRRVVVIPVCDESTGILRPLPPGPGRSLMILVVNQSANAAHHVSDANRAFAAELETRFTARWQSDPALGLTLFHDSHSPRDLLLVDRFSTGLRLPPGGGVGHARKTGADFAARLIWKRKVRSAWIHCSDADVRLPEGYFACSAEADGSDARDTAALVYPFRHVSVPGESSEAILRATRLYEFSLDYYVAGLRYAGSPYAFHTVGSTMAVNAAHYAKVRGFPRREAGEDFYLLNKLAKVGSIRQLGEDPACQAIGIAARLSDRVPFGTGAAVGKIVAMKEPEKEFYLYHPAVFGFLREWLECLPAFWEARSSDIGAILFAPDQRELAAAVEEIGVGKALQHALRQSPDAAQFERQMHTWFDAFRTLKLIHYLRDHHLPPVSFEALMTEHDIGHLEPFLSSMIEFR
jgi:hypothetical protein